MSYARKAQQGDVIAEMGRTVLFYPDPESQKKYPGLSTIDYPMEVVHTAELLEVVDKHNTQ